MRIKCPLCQSDFGQELKFLYHLCSHHSITDFRSLYIETVLNNVIPLCDCGCGQELKWVNWKKGFASKYLRGHNAKIDSVYFNKERQKQFAEKRSEGYKSGRNKAWNAGLTKKSDKRIENASIAISDTLKKGHASGTIVDWHLDKDKSEKASVKQSETKKKKFLTGELTAWNKGLTKETNVSVANSAANISLRHKKPNAGSNPASFDKQRLSTNVNELSLAAAKCRLELYEFVKSLSQDAVLSDRNALSPKELDVYVPSKRFGIEYNGLYFHSEACGDKTRLQEKTDLAMKKDITVLHVFEDEWRDKRAVVEQMIKHRLGMSSRRLGARKCVVKELSSSQRRDFFESNHIDGDTRAMASWGLFFKDELVAALSLRKPFHSSHNDVLEVSRFALAKDTSVQGALSRLSKHALEYANQKGYRAIMSYVDKRVGHGNGYTAAGYSLIRETKPRFWWTDFINRFNRFAVRADASKGITQEKAANEAGVVRVWGCSNLVFELRRC